MAQSGGSPSRILVGPSGGTFEEITGYEYLRNVVMSDDGSALFIEDGPNGAATNATFFYDVASGVRVRASSSAFAQYGAVNVMLSDDGQVMTAPFAGGLWLLRRGVADLAGFPALDEVRFRYDEDDDLVIRVHVTADDGDPTIGLQALNGYLDWYVAPVAADDNPFAAPFPSFAAVDGEADTYEVTVALGGKRSLIGEETTIRVWVRSEPDNRAVFVDFSPL
jgi:hypothetical protein